MILSVLVLKITNQLKLKTKLPIEKKRYHTPFNRIHCNTISQTICRYDRIHYTNNIIIKSTNIIKREE